MSLAPCPTCSRHVRQSEDACPFCGATFAAALVPTSKLVSGVSRAMLVFGGVVALSAAIEGCGDTIPAAAAMYGAPPVVEDAGMVPPAAPSTSSSGPTSDAPKPPPGAIVAMYGAPPAPEPPAKADAGAKPMAPMAPAAAYGAPPSFLPPPKDGPKPKKP